MTYKDDDTRELIDALERFIDLFAKKRKKKESKWNRMKYQVPLYECMYILVCDSFGNMFVAERDNKCRDVWWLRGAPTTEIKDIVYWRYLPKKPEGI